ncbi:MAG TPA: chemotaxis protein CheB, partial [Acetobacteraceae bacterium]|nr:chemotaxis protein CheB [Acetobacteraceae bacterium]
MICDDSAVIRGGVARILETDPEVRVVERVANGQQALDVLRRPSAERIDVIVLDIEMPVMDGMTALPLLLRAAPGVRVIMASTLTTRGAEIAMRALSLGASDYVPKPSTAAIADDSFRTELLAKVKGFARLRQRAVLPAAPAPTTPAPAIALRPPPRQPPLLLAVGSSTGGPQALFTLVQGLGKTLPVPVIITQHMPAKFTKAFADRLQRTSPWTVREAEPGDSVLAGVALVAPGSHSLTLRRDGAQL